MARRIDPRLLGHAATMRREPTPYERRLWTALSGQRLGGFKFRRQAVIGDHIVDFYCPEVALVIEIDGATHQPARDAVRDAVLAARGLQVLRFPNQQVSDDCDAVLAVILDVARSLPAAAGDVRVLAGEGGLVGRTLPPAPSLVEGGGVRILGLDPGLAKTGWGIIESAGNRLRHIAHGTVTTRAADPLADRLAALYAGLESVIATHPCDAAAIEEVFVNANPQSTLKLGQARGVVLLAAARGRLPVAEYATRLVKKAIVGVGSAEKQQVHAMVERLLPGAKVTGEDAADALAIAIAHAHLAASARLRGLA
ncbi:MAG: crossover junction endodeoxyribonuclease RuvC [Alphaproteobacteria bacterium PA4]|nr:MAG: crossover junction endodeoxyribonuclease RuvC [Alphaproteobacteria bacterium PA4]